MVRTPRSSPLDPYKLGMQEGVIGDYMSRVVRKPDFCICENKDADQLVFATSGLVVRASDSGSGDPGSILGRVGVLFP